MDYNEISQTWDLDQALQALGLTSKHFNAAVVCCDRHPPDKTALTCTDGSGDIRRIRFVELADASRRLATVLKASGIVAGDRVSVMLPKGYEQVVALLAVWRLGAIYNPLFTAFGSKAVEHRLTQAKAKFLILDAPSAAKLDDLALHLPVLLLSPEGHEGARPDFWTEIRAAAPFNEGAAYDLAHPLLLMFTSGTTGLPKSLLVPNQALAAFATYMRFGIGLQPDSVYWNIADPGWAYGLYFACIGPLSLGIGACLYAGPFSTGAVAQGIVRLGVTDLAGSPTAFRMLMADDQLDVPAIRKTLRSISSAGEPLNASLIRWCADVLGCPIHDHYGQTEAGMVLCNHHGLSHEVQAGTTGFALPGFRLDVIDETGQPCADGATGMLAVDTRRSPLYWFSGYEGQGAPDGSGWYRTGDLAQRNPGGTFSFVGRGDDIITSSGYRIGPFDVESALAEHAAVADVAVAGLPDPERTEVVAAFVVLRDGHAQSPALAEELRLHVRHRLSAHAYPRRIFFVEALPRTPSGKVQRFMLRNEYAGAA